MVTIDGTDITGATIDGTDVSEITIDGESVWTAIPDSVVSLYDATEESTGSTTTVTDQEGTRDLSGSATVDTTAFGGQQAYYLDGSEILQNTSDFAVDADFASVFAFELPTTGQDGYINDGGADFEFGIFDHDSNGVFRVVRDGGITDTSYGPDTDAHTAAFIGYNDGQTVLRVDGTQVYDATMTNTDLGGLTLGGRFNDSENTEVRYGEVSVLRDFSFADIESEEQRLANKWGTPDPS